MGLYVPCPPSHMKWGSGGLNWWAGRGSPPPWIPYLEAPGRQRQVQEGRPSYTCNVTLAPLTVKLKSLKQSSYFRFRFWNVLVNVDRRLPNVDTGHGPRGNPTGREAKGRKTTKVTPSSDTRAKISLV